MSAPTARLAAPVALGLDDVLAATGGDLVQLGATIRFGGVTTDTRTLESGELFVAIRGDAHDGHAFVGDAARRGAGAVVVRAGTPLAALDCTVIAVRDPLAALGDLAAQHRRRHAAAVLAVAGSNGKTTTKEMLAAICRRHFGDAPVVATRGSQNNLVGLPLTLLRIGAETRVAVLEIGMNAPGEVWRLAEIADPDVGLVTCIAEEHLAGVGSLRGAALANGELFRRMRPSTTAVVNADDPWTPVVAAGAVGTRVRFGDDGDVRARDVDDAGIEGTRFVLVAGGIEQSVRLRVPGRHNVGNALAAIAAATVAGVPIAVACAALEEFTAPQMRMQRLELVSGVVVLNDCYNANPGSMRAALQTLAASRATRRVAVLGEMLELGEDTVAAHRALGALAAASAERLFLLGSHAAVVAESAVANGLPTDRITIASDHEALGAALCAEVRPGDLVLLKGSRGAALERVLPALTGERPAG